ncbi:MAG TPA: hypothetical protein VGD50_03160 [Candidatus Baltobacteraceae bacterium]
MPATSAPTLDLSDIQATVLRSRPSPYKGKYVGLRIDDVRIAFTFAGLKALGLPRASLDSFPSEFREPPQPQALGLATR